MKIRRYTPADIPELMLYLQQDLQETHYKKFRFAKDKVLNLLQGNATNLTFFCNVVETDDGQVGGALVASIVQLMFTYEVIAQDHITYIRPEFRSLKTITGLVRSYVEWGRERGAREVRWSQSSAFKMEKFAVLAKRLGFEQIGSHFMMEI